MRSFAPVSLAVAGTLTISACLGSAQPDRSAFFLLSSPPLSATLDTAMDATVGVGPITLPGYLDRPQMVVRLSDHQIALTEVDRWAEPLADNLARTLEENLGKLLPGPRFVRYPWYAGEEPTYAVSLDVRRFEAGFEGAVVLDASWQITREGRVADGGSALIEDQATEPGQGAAVAAQSRALAALSSEIAGAIRRAAR